MTDEFISVHAEKEIKDDSGYSKKPDNVVKFIKIDSFRSMIKGTNYF
jgi:hypothetical protein